MFVYPEPNMDDPRKLLGLVGTAWTHYYGDGEPLTALVEANQELLKQNRQNIKELIDCASRKDVPLYHQENWMALAFRVNESDSWGQYPLPDGIVSIPIMMNRMTDATLILFEGLDYLIDVDESTIQFITVDPCDDDVSVSHGEDAAYLWGFHVKVAYDYVYTAHGYLMGLDPPEDGDLVRYKNTINAIADCATLGTTIQQLTAVLAAVLRVPLADGHERVLSVSHDGRGPFIATDRHIHRIPPGSAHSAPVGSQPRRGTPLTNTFEIMDLKDAPSDITDVNQKLLRSEQCILLRVDPKLVDDALLNLVARVLPPYVSFATAPREVDSNERPDTDDVDAGSD